MIRVGKIVATHGLSGSLIMTHVLDSSDWLRKGHALYVEMQKGSYIPYFVSQCKQSDSKEYIISVEEIDKVETSKKLVSKHVYVDESVISSYAKKSPLLWIGFSLMDVQKGNIGNIKDVIHTGSQWIATVIYQNTEILIPLIPETLLEVNIQSKVIKLNLPEGLLEIYIG